MKPHRKQELPEDLKKCEYEPMLEGDEESSWAVEIPEDAGVIVSMEIRTPNGLQERVRWGGGNQSGRWELRHVEEAD